MDLWAVVLALHLSAIPGVPPHLSVILEHPVYPSEEDVSVLGRLTCSLVRNYHGLVTYSLDWLDGDTPERVFSYYQQSVSCPLPTEGEDRGEDGTDRRAEVSAMRGSLAGA